MPLSIAARLRMALLMTFAVYPIVVAYVTLIGLFTPGWQFWQRSIILVPFMVATIVFLVTPLITKRFGRFITGRKTLAA